METKKCEICGRELPAEEFSKSYKNRCKECVAILEREKRKNKRIAYPVTKYIDWEQRRYEISSRIYVENMKTARVQPGQNLHEAYEALAVMSIVTADILIKKLQSSPL